MRVARRTLAGLCVAAVVGGAAAAGARMIGVHPVKIASGSMSPAVKRGDWIVVRDLDTRRRGAVGHGDVVMFRFPLGTTGRAIKRVVATAGDRVAIDAHSVTVNGHSIPIAGAPGAYAAGPRVETVPHGRVFLLGDNAAVSIDSRSFGTVPTREIIARQLMVAGRPTALIVPAVAALAATLLLLLAVRDRARSRIKARIPG